MTALATIRRKPSKAAYKPFVRIADRKRGHYTVQSESYGGHVLYLVDAVNGTCECDGNRVWGKVCKHIKAAQFVHAAFAPKPEPAPEFAALAREFAALPVVMFDFRTKPVTAAGKTGAELLMECFGVEG